MRAKRMDRIAGMISGGRGAGRTGSRVGLSGEEGSRGILTDADLESPA
jgi:hypothetical protein